MPTIGTLENGSLATVVDLPRQVLDDHDLIAALQRDVDTLEQPRDGKPLKGECCPQRKILKASR